jgi:transposase-like protein
MTPKTLLEAVRYFSDVEVCEQYMQRIRWPGGKPVCPNCESARIGEIATRRMLRCKDCRKQFSHKVGTIFEASPLGLDKWFVAVWCIANCKNGISSHELGRAIGVTQRTAWFMLHRIRTAMEVDEDRFDGPAEADTSYVGGKAENMHTKRREKLIRGRGAVGKKGIHGVLQRTTEQLSSQVRATVLDDQRSESVLGHIRSIVTRGAPVYTDEARAYGDLGKTHTHEAVDHSVGYVLGHVHTNGLENFWSLLKRALGGTYVSVAPFHLFRYVSEQVFRFNARKLTDGDRFRVVLSQVFGRRLTYRLLAAVDGAGFMTIA